MLSNQRRSGRDDITHQLMVDSLLNDLTGSMTGSADDTGAAAHAHAIGSILAAVRMAVLAANDSTHMCGWYTYRCCCGLWLSCTAGWVEFAQASVTLAMQRGDARPAHDAVAELYA